MESHQFKGLRPSRRLSRWKAVKGFRGLFGRVRVGLCFSVDLVVDVVVEVEEGDEHSALRWGRRSS